MRAAAIGAFACVAACGTAVPGPSSSGGDDTPAADAPIAPPSDAAPDAVVFDEAATFEPTGALCDIPADYVASGGDPYRPPCQIAVGNYRDPVPPKSSLRVVAWNVEFGNDAATVIAALSNRPELANADLLLLSEVPRQSLTSNPDNIDLAHDLAVALHRSYAFAVEWDRREVAGELGEHGVAVLSRYPIAHPRMLRHAQLNDWYSEDHLYGGRVSLGVDILVGSTVLSAYVSHFDTRGTGDAGRAQQAAELRADATAQGRPAIVIDGGDFNTWTCNPLVSDCTVAPDAEATVENFLSDGWHNGDGSWNGVTQIGKGFFPQRLDWIFYRGPGGTPGQADANAQGSDHLPVYADIQI